MSFSFEANSCCWKLQTSGFEPSLMNVTFVQLSKNNDKTNYSSQTWLLFTVGAMHGGTFCKRWSAFAWWVIFPFLSIISLRKCTSPLHASIKKLGVNSVIIWTLEEWPQLKRELLLLSRPREEPTSNVVCYSRSRGEAKSNSIVTSQKKWSRKVTNGQCQQWHVINVTTAMLLLIQSYEIRLYPHDLKFLHLGDDWGSCVFLVHFLLRFSVWIEGRNDDGCHKHDRAT